MGIRQNKYRFVVWYMLGFLIGILYANFIARSYITMTGIFHEYFLNQYTQMKIVTEDYMWYLLRCRVLPLGFVVFMGSAGFRKFSATACLIWTGFSSGVLAVAAVLRMGAKGMLLCVAGIFPHFIFYIFAYVVILYYFYHYPETKWNVKKTMFVFVMFVTGILLEVYVNPTVMREIMKILF